VCEGKSSIGTALIERYIAKLQGGKAVVKEDCFSEGFNFSLRSVLTQGHCKASQCGTYDVYRRGPLWFSLFMASLNAALLSSEVKIFEAAHNEGELNGEELNMTSMFRLEEHHNTQRQIIKFKFSEDVDCIAQLKFYRDQSSLDRIDGLGQVNQELRLTSSPSAGVIFAEHREKRGGRGFEVLITESRLAKERQGGEVLERELLCERANGPIDLMTMISQFSLIDRDRDTTRVFTSPYQESRQR
jgi:hypothetical protein